MEKVKVSFEESAFIVDVEGKKLRVSYKQAELPFKKAMEFCKENGGGDETVENLRLLAKYRDNKLSARGEVYEVGERIAQLIIMPIPAVEFVEVAELDDSDRGTGGYGSTGK